VDGHSEKVAFIWSVADLLRGDYKASDYGRVIPLLVAMGCLTISTMLCLPLNAARAESWLCIADGSAGFDKKGATWSPAIFSTSTKIIIKPLDLSDEEVRGQYDAWSKHMTEEEKLLYNYSYAEFGYPFKSGLCDTRSYDHHVIYCREMGGGIPNEEMIVNLTLMRFQRYHPYGYIFQTDKTVRLTPFIEIGTCSHL
jgi:hypothetical protein